MTAKTTLYLLGWFLICIVLSSCNEDTSREEINRVDPYLELSLEERQSAAHAADAFELANGLAVGTFATEPMVVNPTNLAIDARGRIWVCESYNYAVPEEEQTETGGRITILEDTDQDGRADKRTVYYQGEDVHSSPGKSRFCHPKS